MLLFFAKERPEALVLFENTNSILADLLFVLQDIIIEHKLTTLVVLKI